MSARCHACRQRVTPGAPYCRSCGAPQPLEGGAADGAAWPDASEPWPLESQPPPSLPESSWHGVRRLLALYGLMLGSSAFLALLLALKAGPEPVLDAVVSGLSALLVVAFSLGEWRLLLPLLTPRNVQLKQAGPIAFGVVVTVLVLQAYFFVLGSLGVPSYQSWPSFEQAGWPLWSAFVLLAAMPGIFEELAFRGLIYEGLMRVMAKREALLVQAMAFSVLHLSPLIFISHFLMGLSLGLLRDATKSLYLECWLLPAGTRGVSQKKAA